MKSEVLQREKPIRNTFIYASKSRKPQKFEQSGAQERAGRGPTAGALGHASRTSVSQVLSTAIIKTNYVNQNKCVKNKGNQYSECITSGSSVPFHSSLCYSSDRQGCIPLLEGPPKACHGPTRLYFAFGDITRGVGNRPWWEYLLQKNQRILEIRTFSFHQQAR